MEFVRIVAADGHVFVVRKDIAMGAGTIETMLSSSFAESSRNEIKFPDIKRETLDIVLRYLHYKWRYQGLEDFPEFPIEPSQALEVLVVADYLNV